jgi:PEP-CTERM motif-containing protein
MSVDSGPATTFRRPVVLGFTLAFLLCAPPVFAIPFQVNIAPNTPLDFGVNVTSGGAFGGAGRDTLSLGNWIYDFTVTESKQFQPPQPGTPKRDRLLATGFLQHNVKPPGPEHATDEDHGKPLNFGFFVDATEPNKPMNLNGGVAGGETHSLNHFDSFSIANLRLNTNPATREINSWSFRVEGHHLEAAPAPVPEPATLLLVGTTAAGLGLARWRQRRRKQQQP